MPRSLVLGVVLLLVLVPGCFRSRITTSSNGSGKIASNTQRGVDAKSSGSVKGKMTLNVEGTNLDFLLEEIRIRDNSFQLSGQGVKLVGTIANPPGKDDGKLTGQAIVIQARNNVFGDSELDLPGTGVAPVTGGQIQVEGVNERRLRGRISFRVQGPFGERTFAGTCEVGIIGE
ncbi:MAG TPA: hypothetical protein VGZ47_21165 [Gemmataceae bacterium]|jgi:hypothetical protein|nr:hypothetical protein [Gemmataceae bacterium]